MRELLLIGIGSGGPEQLTFEAAAALEHVDVFFLLEKGAETAELVELRRSICELHATKPSVRFVTVPDAERDRDAVDYRGAVADWRRRRAERLADAIHDELPEGGCGGLLVWGDPAFYDSTLAVVDAVRAGGLELAVDVVPGISSLQVLAARHRIALTRIGRPLLITTGRLLADGWLEGCDDVAVMLDAHCSFRTLPAGLQAELDIYWGAYLGLPDELLVAGPVAEVAGEIATQRERARERKGWVMDSYLLRRRA